MFLTALSAVAIILGMYLVIRPASAARRTVRLLDRMNVLHPSVPLMQLGAFFVGAFLFIFGALNLFHK